MSWDVFLIRFDRVYRSLDELPADARPVPLGDAASFRERVSAAFPGVDWSEPAWGVWNGPSGSIEFNVGDDDPVESVMLHVRAGGDVVSRIVALADALRCHAIDTSGDTCFLEQAENPESGLDSWREYRDKVIGDPG